MSRETEIVIKYINEREAELEYWQERYHREPSASELVRALKSAFGQPCTDQLRGELVMHALRSVDWFAVADDIVGRINYYDGVYAGGHEVRW